MITNLKKEECIKILNNNYIGYLAYVYKNLPFVVPITYYFDKQSTTIIGYMGEGHKTKALKINNSIALEVADIKCINDWKSVLIQGTFEELKGSNAKNELHKFSDGVKKLIVEKENKEFHFISEFSAKVDSQSLPIVYRINIQEITGKEQKSKKTLGVFQIKS